MKGEEKQVSQEADALGSHLEKTVAQHYEEAIKKVSVGNLTLAKLMGMTPERLETVYAHAYRLYNNGKYKDAAQIFRYLMMVSPGEVKYILGLAACCHLLKDFKAAAHIYLICDILDPKSPIADFHASDCYLQTNDKISAIVVLNMAIEKAGERPEYKILKDRALLTVEALNKELKLEPVK